MNDWSKLFEQAQNLQKEMEKADTALAKIKVTGIAGAGMAKVQLNGKMEVQSISLEDELLKQPKNVIEELIAGAMRDAVEQVKSQSKSHFSGLGSLMNMPGDLFK